MAIETYTNAKAILTDNHSTEIYTAPIGKSAIVHSIFFANLAEHDTLVTLSVESNNETYVVGNSIKIRKHTSLSWSKPINILFGDKIKVQSSSLVGDITVFASILELEFGV